MEDGHTLFDYDVRLNDTIQLLVRQSLVLPVPVPGSSSGIKERDSELSDTDSGCGLAQSESDKSSNSGEAANEPEGKADEDECDETELGLYKVGLLHCYPHAAPDARGWQPPVLPYVITVLWWKHQCSGVPSLPLKQNPGTGPVGVFPVVLAGAVLIRCPPPLKTMTLHRFPWG